MVKRSLIAGLELFACFLSDSRKKLRVLLFLLVLLVQTHIWRNVCAAMPCPVKQLFCSTRKLYSLQSDIRYCSHSCSFNS